MKPPLFLIEEDFLILILIKITTSVIVDENVKKYMEFSGFISGMMFNDKFSLNMNK